MTIIQKIDAGISTLINTGNSAVLRSSVRMFAGLTPTQVDDKLADAFFGMCDYITKHRDDVSTILKRLEGLLAASGFGDVAPNVPDWPERMVIGCGQDDCDCLTNALISSSLS